MLKNFLINFLIMAKILTSSPAHAMLEDEQYQESANNPHAVKTSVLPTKLSLNHSVDLNGLETYFNELSNRVNSYRVFTIWSAGEKEKISGYKSYIGGLSKKGDDRRAVTWFNWTHSFLEASKKFKGDFIFEIILDEKTFEDNKSKITTLQQNFSKSVKLTLIEDSLVQLKTAVPSKVFSLLQHLKKGNPAIGSDILRVLKLYDPDYALSVYIDPDSFVHHLKFFQKMGGKPKVIKTELFLQYQNIFKGELTVAEGENNTLARIKYSSGEEYCNDYLISKGNTQGKLKESIEVLENFLKENDLKLRVLNWYQYRSQYFTSYQLYKEELDKVFKDIHAVFENRTPLKLVIIELPKVVTYVTGPTSCLYSLFKNIDQRAISFKGKGTWTFDRVFLNVEGFDGFCKAMEDFYSEKALEILTTMWKVRWMIHDYDMLSSIQEHKKVSEEVRADLLTHAAKVRSLLESSPILFKYKDRRSEVIAAINKTFKDDKLWFSKIDLIP